MRVIQCRHCGFRVDETLEGWERAIATNRCPRCTKPLQTVGQAEVGPAGQHDTERTRQDSAALSLRWFLNRFSVSRGIAILVVLFLVFVGLQEFLAPPTSSPDGAPSPDSIFIALAVVLLIRLCLPNFGMAAAFNTLLGTFLVFLPLGLLSRPSGQGFEPFNLGPRAGVAGTPVIAALLFYLVPGIVALWYGFRRAFSWLW